MRSFLFACLLSAASLPAAATTIVSGHVSHPKGATVMVILREDPLTFAPLSQASARLDAKGDFRLELPALKAPQEATFAHGDETTQLFLSPGDNLRLSLDTEQFDETLRYSGSGAVANTFLSQYFLRFEDEQAASPTDTVGGSSFEEIQGRMDADRQRRLTFLADYAKLHPLLPVFRAYARQRIEFEWATNLLLMPPLYRMSTGKEMLLPADYYSPLAALRPVQDSALAMNNGSYLTFLGLYADTRLAPDKQLPGSDALLAGVSQQFGASASRDLALAKFLYGKLMRNDVLALAPLLPAFQRTNRDSTLARTLRTKYQQRLLLAAGREAPALRVRDASGKEVSLADFKGKVVYLDFWASWCAPCMAEVPASVALKKQFEGKDVVFLYVSIDSKEASWRQALAKHPLSSSNSVHTWTQGFEGLAAKGYQVESIPSYFLIGRDGRLLNSSAPRPSEGQKTVAALEQALGR